MKSKRSCGPRTGPPERPQIWSLLVSDCRAHHADRLRPRSPTSSHLSNAVADVDRRRSAGLLAAGVPSHLLARRQAQSALSRRPRMVPPGPLCAAVDFRPSSRPTCVSFAAILAGTRRGPSAAPAPDRPRVLVVQLHAPARSHVDARSRRTSGCRHVHAHFAPRPDRVPMAAGALLGLRSASPRVRAISMRRRARCPRKFVRRD